MCIAKGTIIKTSYNTGPYVVDRIHGPCKCPSFLSTLNQTKENPAKDSAEHYHFIVKDADGKSKSDSYLNGYAKAGDRILSVWGDDEIFIIGEAEPTLKQLELF